MGLPKYAFTKVRFCQTNLNFFFEKKADFLDKINAVELMDLDFSKAFDMVLVSRGTRAVR